MENITSSVSIYDRISYIIEYFQFAFGLIGVTGNILAIIVFSRSSLSKYSYSFYCRTMAISDIILMAYGFIDWAAYNLGADLLTVGQLSCKLLKYFRVYFGGISIHLLTIIAIDRMLTIVYPSRFAVIKKRWFQYLVVAVLACFIVPTCIIVLIYYQLIEIRLTNSSQPIRLCFLQTYISNIQMWIIISSFIVLNIFINNFLNVKTIRFIMASRRRVVASGRNSSLSSRDRKFAIS